MDSVNPLILADGRALLDPKGGGVFEYANRLIPALKEAGLDIRTWANSFAPAEAAHVDVMTRWPNKILNAGMKFGLKAPAFAGAVTRPARYWMPNLNFAAVPQDMPLVLTVHDLSFERYPEFFSPKRRMWHTAVGPKALCRRADAIIAVSENTKRDLIELYDIEPEKIHVTYLGVSTPAASRQPSAALPARYILHVGALEPRKNHLALIDAFHALKQDPAFGDLGLVLAGPEGWNNEPIVRAIESSSWRKDIVRLGFVAPEEKAALYRDAAVFAFPSFHEGFGLPPIEAMASGTPVVASFAASLGEVVGDAGLLVDPYRPAELAEALRAVLTSPSLSEKLSERGKENAARFSWAACAETTAGVFQSLA